MESPSPPNFSPLSTDSPSPTAADLVNNSLEFELLEMHLDTSLVDKLKLRH